jgi:NTE family protein
MAANGEPAPGGAERFALVLSGGGARGAYQVGVLRGLRDLGLLGPERAAFDIFVGSSAGALNAGVLAAYADRFEEGLARLERVWTEIEPDQVFRTDLRSLGRIGFRWVRDLSFGGALRRVGAKSLLDTEPLRALLAARVPFERLDGNVASGALRALAVSATDLYTGTGVVFVHGSPQLPLWTRGRWSIERAAIGVEHLMASSAIPIFFPSVKLAGRHFGDGCIRNTAPLSPAINLGADRILAVGVRGVGRRSQPAPRAPRAPTIAEIAGVLLDAVMLDAIEVDVEHSERVNRSIVAAPTRDPRNPFRSIDVLWLRPSRSVGDIAAELADRVPGIVRYLMRGLGTDEATIELASYLLFDSVYCGRLVALGQADVHASAEPIGAFFRDGEPRLSLRGA